MRGFSVPEAIDAYGQAHEQGSDPSNVSSLRLGGQTVWAVDLGRGASVGRIAVELLDEMADYWVLVDGVAVARRPRIGLALACAHRLEANPDQAARARDRALETIEASS